MAPATIAIWSGVTVSCSCPIAMRAVSSSWSSLGRISSPLRRPETCTSGRSIGGRSPKPNAVIVAPRRSGPSTSPMVAKVVLIEKVSAVGRVCRPKL